MLFPLRETRQPTYALGNSDSVGARTLTEATYNSGNAMTDEACVSFCISKNFIYAGTEYAGECCKFSFPSYTWVIFYYQISFPISLPDLFPCIATRSLPCIATGSLPCISGTPKSLDAYKFAESNFYLQTVETLSPQPVPLQPYRIATWRAMVTQQSNVAGQTD